jgi:hypothetical protein
LFFWIESAFSFALTYTNEISLPELERRRKYFKPIPQDVVNDIRELEKNQSLAAFPFPMFDATGAAKTGLTVTAQRSIDGAAFGFEFLKRLDLRTPDQLKPYIKAVHHDTERRPIAEQIIDRLLAEDEARYKVYEEIRAARPLSARAEEHTETNWRVHKWRGKKPGAGAWLGDQSAASPKWITSPCNVFSESRMGYSDCGGPMSGFGSLESGTPLLPVNADDLKRVWYMIQRVTKDLTAEVRAQGVGIGAELIAEQCEADADVPAVFIRAVLLQYLFQVGVLDKWREGNEPSDPVFQVGATCPMELGVQGFDPAAFIERLHAL